MQYSASNIEKMIIFFIFICLIFVGAFLLLNIREGKLFARHISLMTALDKGYSFNKGAVVKVNGINAGVIEEIEMDENNAVWVTMRISQPFTRNIHKDAVAEIIEPIALGSTGINILPGSTTEPLVEDGDFIPARTSASLAQRLEGSFNEVEAIVSETHKTLIQIRTLAENLSSITRKIDKGEGSLGQMVNDPALYNSAKEAVDSTRTIVEGIKATKIFVGLDSNYYYHQDVAVSKFHLRVVPRESRYFWLGGALFNLAGDSDIVMDDSNQSYKVFPEFIVAQKVFDNRLTFRGGLLEGKFGGGIDFLPFSEARETFQLTVEARDTYDSGEFNENIDGILLRAKARLRFFKYFNLEIGGDNLLDDPAFSIGIGFEYLDEDISKIVGLIGAGK